MTPLESIAHDLICIVKFNGTGGTATAAELKRVTAYLARLGKLPEPALPRVAITPPPAVRVQGLMIADPTSPRRAVIVAIPPK